MLESVETGGSSSLFKNGKKIWETTKRYDRSEFLDDETSVGYAIDIYQESINKTFREYLVNFNYLVRLMENYGFVPLTNNEFKQLDLPGSIGDFEEMFNFMNGEIKRDKRVSNKIGNALSMSKEEKTISFLNKYFVFKKVRNYNDASILDKAAEEEKADEELDEQFDLVDKELETMQKESLAEKSKKLAKEFMLEEEAEKEKLEQEALKPKQSKAQLKMSIDEKIKLAEEKKKAKEAEKQKEKEAKALAKASAKEAKALEKEEKKKLKEESKKSKK